MLITQPAYFISDLHLSEHTTGINRLFDAFLDKLTHQARTTTISGEGEQLNLFILGDFFDYYLADDVMTDFQCHIAQQLAKATQSGLSIYLMAGNRDFLIGQAFCTQAQITYLHDPTVLVTLSGTRLLLTHGDWLCREDRYYQYYRTLAHNKFLQNSFLKLPKSWRKKTAHYLKSKSQQKAAHSAHFFIDIDPAFCAKLVKQHQATRLIHGHTHWLGLHRHQQFHRYVLGDWQPYLANALCMENNQLHRLIWSL